MRSSNSSLSAPGEAPTIYSYGETVDTVTDPAGGTKISTYSADGRLASVTGTAEPATTYSYAFDSSGNLNTTATLSTGQNTCTVTDWVGRTVSATASAWGGATLKITNIFNALGQLSAQNFTSSSVKVRPTKLYAYEPYGRLYLEAVDTNDNGTIDVATDASVQQHDLTYVQMQGTSLLDGSVLNSSAQWYTVQTLTVWPYDADSGGSSRASSSRIASQCYTQISGLTDALASNVFSVDFDRNWTQTTSNIHRSTGLVTSSTFTTGSSRLGVVETLLGQKMYVLDVQGHDSDFVYDGFGRLIAQTDPRIGNTIFTYVPGTIWVSSILAPDGKTTSTSYDSAGRVVVRVDPDLLACRCQYDVRGNVTFEWGDTPNPVQKVYDELGRLHEMYTYRSGSWNSAALPSSFTSGTGDKTTWTYEANSGLLQSKTDALGRGTSYTYDGAGRMLTRTDPRGVVTTYGYFGPSYASSAQFNGLQCSISYSLSSGVAATSNVAYTYDRTGRIKTVSDAAGARTFNYYQSWTSDSYDAELQNKSGKIRQEVLPSAFFGSRTLAYGYQYSISGRHNGDLASVQYGASSDYLVSYSYDDRMRLGQVATNATALPFTYSYTDGSNLVATIAQWTGTAASYRRTYGYQSNANRIQTLQQSWGANSACTVQTQFGYNAVGLRSSEATAGGNLMSALGRSAGLYSGFTYSARRELESSGQYDLNSSWGSSGNALGDSIRIFYYDPIGNRTADQNGNYTANAINEYTASSGAASLSYDLAGNLLFDGARTYTYDAENRLASVVQAGITSTFKYDYMGRRISKTVGSTETRYIYNGWLLLAEISPSYDILRSYAWGTDASGTTQDAGGVGGLLCIGAGASSYFPIYDGSFNVIGLYDGAGAIAAAYRYDTFGNLLQSAGTAAAIPIGFSTKYTDRETGLIYYGQRYYNSSLGRFVNRDPLEEKGGANLFAFCRNDGVNRWDVNGLNYDVYWVWVAAGTQETQTAQVESQQDAAGKMAEDDQDSENSGQDQTNADDTDQEDKTDAAVADNNNMQEKDQKKPTAGPPEVSKPSAPNSEPMSGGGGLGIGGVSPHDLRSLAELQQQYADLLKNGDYRDVNSAALSGLLKILLYGGSGKWEYAFGIYRDDDGKIQLSPFVTNHWRGTVALGSDPTFQSLAAAGRLLGWGHNHPGPGGESFSGLGGDKGFSERFGIPGFVVTPSLVTMRYDGPDLSNWKDQYAFYGYTRPEGTVSSLTSIISPNDLADLAYYYRRPR